MVLILQVKTNIHWLCIQIKMPQNLMQCENYHLKQLWYVAICDRDSEKKCQYENPVSSASGPGAGAGTEFEDECLAATRATKKSVERRETRKDLMENDWDAMVMKNLEKKRTKKETLDIVWGFVFILWWKSEEMVMLFILVCKRMCPLGAFGWFVQRSRNYCFFSAFQTFPFNNCFCSPLITYFIFFKILVNFFDC